MDKRVNKGFTLIECMMSLSLFVIISTLALSVYMSGYEFYRSAETQAELVQSVRMAAGRIIGNARVLDNPSEQIYISGHFLVVGDYRYYLQNNILLERKGGGTNQLALNIDKFEPVIKGDKLSLTIEGKKEGEDQDFKITASLHIGDLPRSK